MSTKNDLIQHIAQTTGLRRADAEAALSALLDGIKSALQSGDKVTLVGFGTFSVARSPEREGVNPANGQRMKIPARNRVKFKPGSGLKEAVAG